MAVIQMFAVAIALMNGCMASSILIEAPDCIQAAARMDTFYPDGRVSKLVILNLDALHRRWREDYYSIRRAGIRRHHSSFKDFKTRKHVMAMSKMSFQGVQTPASCMEIPLMEDWPFDDIRAELHTAPTARTITTGFSTEDFEDTTILASEFAVILGDSEFSLLAGSLPSDAGQGSVLNIDQLPFRPLVLRSFSTRTNYTLLHFSTRCSALHSAEQDLIDMMTEGDAVFAETAGRLKVEALSTLFEPSLVADIQCEPLS